MLIKPTPKKFWNVRGPAPHYSTGSGGGGGGLAFNSSQTDNFTSNTTFTQVTGMTTPVNCVNVACVGWFTSGTTISVTGVSDPIGAYTLIGGNSGTGVALYYAVRPLAQSGNKVTCTTSAATTLDIHVIAFTGVNAGTPIDTGGTFSGVASGPVPAPAWTTSVANTILIGAYGPNNGQFTVSGGTWVAIAPAGLYNGFVYEIVSSSGVQTPPTTAGDGGLFASVTSALRA